MGRAPGRFWAAVECEADVDLGVPSLGNLLEPIAERSLRENVAAVLRSLLGERVRVESEPAADARAHDR